IAVAIGYFGVLYRTSKEQWLHYRLITERLRQWHAQSLVGQIPAILAAAHSEGERAKFRERRAAQFDEFKRQTIAQVAAAFPRYVADPARGAQEPVPNLVWIRSEWKEPEAHDNIDPEDPYLPRLFGAYESIRMCGQLQYTSYKLRGTKES